MCGMLWHLLCFKWYWLGWQLLWNLLSLLLFVAVTVIVLAMVVFVAVFVVDVVVMVAWVPSGDNRWVWVHSIHSIEGNLLSATADHEQTSIEPKN